MTELEQLLNKARQLAEARNHKLLPFVRRSRSTGSRCVTCGRQVYVMPDAGVIGVLQLAVMPLQKFVFESRAPQSRQSFLSANDVEKAQWRAAALCYVSTIPKRKGWKLFCHCPRRDSTFL